MNYLQMQKEKQRRRLKVYVSKPMDYPEQVYQQIVKYLENKNFIVTTWDKKTKYTEDQLIDADVVLFDTQDHSPIRKENQSYGYVTTHEEIARGQHTEVNLAKKLDKLCVTVSHFRDDVFYVLETVKSEVSDKGEAYWGQGYAELISKSYGGGAEFSDFVTGYMASEKRILHDFHSKENVKNKRLLLLCLPEIL